MKCPKGFAQLPGQTYSSAARDLSRTLKQEDHQLVERLIAQGLENESSIVEHDSQVVAYAAASLVFTHVWTEWISNPSFAPVINEMRERHAHGSYSERVKSFMRVYLGLIRALQQKFFEDVKRRRVGEDGFSYSDKLFFCFGLHAPKDRESSEKGIPIPSMNDLVVLFGRLAGVLPEVYRRDIGRDPSSLEIMEVLRDPSVLGFCTELMANSKEVVLPLISQLEGVERGDLNNLENRFLPDPFTLELVGDRLALRVREEVVSAYRQSIENMTKGTNPKRTLGCPALYGGKFREVFRWVDRSFEAWVTHP